MPCSCGNTTCACGIPCCCSEELCKCDYCAIGLQRLCKICNKPVIADIQTVEGTCSCFEGDPAALTFESKDNPQWRIGNIPITDGGFVHGKLSVNMIIPVLPQSTLQRPSSLMPFSPLIQTESRNILPSDAHVTASPRFGEVPGIPSTSELLPLLAKSNEQSSYQAPSGIFSTAVQNSEISSQKTCFSPGLQSTDKKTPTNMVQSTKSEIEGHATVEQICFYLPSISIDDISYPVGMNDPVWELSSPAFSNAATPGLSLKICNPFSVIPSSAPKKNDRIEPSAVSGEEWQNINFGNLSTTPNIPGYFDFPTTSKLQGLFTHGSQSFEENGYPKSGNFGSDSSANKKKLDSIPLYIDTFTNQNIEKLMKPVQHTSASSLSSTSKIFSTPSSDENANFSNSIYGTD